MVTRVILEFGSTHETAEVIDFSFVFCDTGVSPARSGPLPAAILENTASNSMNARSAVMPGCLDFAGVCLENGFLDCFSSFDVFS